MAIKSEVIGNGVVFTGAGRRAAIVADDLSADILKTAMLHGLKQKIGDSAALERDASGKSASDEMKMAAIEAMIARLESGEWNASAREASGGMLLEAMVLAYPDKTRESLREWLSGKSDAEKRALRASKKLLPIIQKLEMAKAKDGEELFEGL